MTSEARLFAPGDLSVGAALVDLFVCVLDLLGEAVADPVLYATGQMQVRQILGFFALVDAVFYGLTQLHHELFLAGKHLSAAGKTVTRQHGFDLQLFRRTQDRRPVTDIAVAGEIIRPIGSRIASTEDLFLWQIDEAVTTRVRPPEEIEFYRRAPSSRMNSRPGKVRWGGSTLG